MSGGRVIQRQALHLGEINDAQRAGWVHTIEVIEGDHREARQLALFAEDRESLPELSCEAVRVRLEAIQLRNPRQWGACWLALYLWNLLDLDRFWTPRLPPSRKATRWLNVLKALVCYRLIDPGSEWRFHREWFVHSAIGDLLGEDFALAQKDKPYRCLDRLLAHRDELFDFLKERWGQLFGVQYDVLLYDLTSTYFESEPPPPGSSSKKRFGYSRDHRPDCVQVVIALVVTPEGFPIAYEIYPGNTRDTTTLEAFLARIETRYGKARRVWLMDRGVPTEDTLEKMRLWATLTELRSRKRLTRDDLLMALGAAKKEAGRAFYLVTIHVPKPDEAVSESTFRFSLNREKLRRTRRREGRYLLRSTMRSSSPETVWENYLLLVRIEQAFKDIKGDLAVRPIWHQKDKRIEAHIFVCFPAYCLHTTLRNLARGRAGGLTSGAILEKMSALQMIDVHLPTTDGRHIILSRYTQPEKDVALLLTQLDLTLPKQPAPCLLTPKRLIPKRRRV